MDLVLGSLLLILLIWVSTLQFLVFHTLIEILAISVAWATFFVFWNGRQYLEDKSFLILGVALFMSGGIDILHTMAYKGMGVFNDPLEGNLSTQLWISARTVETLGWLGLVFLRKREAIHRPASIFVSILAVVFIVQIFYFNNFPTCFRPAPEGVSLESLDFIPGLTPFKVWVEYGLIVSLLIALLWFYRSRKHYQPVLTRDIIGALALIALAEMAFTLYRDVYGVANISGHILRFVSRFLTYRALIHLSISQPQAMFFTRLQSEKNQVASAENLLRSITNATTDHITDLDLDLRIRFVNYPAPGLSEDQILGEKITIFLPDGDEERVEAILRQVLHSKEVETYETVFKSSGVDTINFETRASCRFDDQGQPAGLTLVSRNITERWLRDQLFEARLRISDFALGHTVSELLTKVLDEAESLTGSKIGFFHFVHEDQTQLHLQAWSTNTLQSMCTVEGLEVHYPMEQAGVWADCLRTGTPTIHNDYPNMKGQKGLPEGHAKIVRETVVPITRRGIHVAVFGVGNKELDYNDSDVRLLTELGEMAWDIIVLKRAQINLQESEHRLARIMSHLPGMVFRCLNDEHWTMLYVSEGCHELTGFLPEDLVQNRAMPYSSLIHPDDRLKVNQGVQRGLESRKPYQMVYRIIDQQNNIKWVWEQGRGLWQGNTLELIEGFIYDITEQIEAIEEREAMEKRVLETQKLESLGVLAGGIAHDFNNLLQAMLGFAELAKEQTGEGHSATKSISRVMEAATKAAGLTRQMLAFSGKGQFVIVDLNLSKHVHEMAELLESSVPKYIEFRRELSEELPYIEADETQIQQVVMNLITNAAEAIGDQEGLIILRTGKVHCNKDTLANNLIQYEADVPAPIPGDFVFLEVQDSGCGIEPDMILRVFEPFFTTKFTGRGLGMAAVQGIIRGHRGVMLVESEPDVGSTFRVLFPATGAIPPVETPSAAHNVANLERPQNDLVLVVDDEDKVLELVELTLAPTPYKTLLVRDGQEALDVFKEKSNEIACVLLDLVMPRMGGKECLTQMLALDPMVQVVVMSGYSEIEIRNRLADMKVAGILPKPFRAQEMMDMLEWVAPMK